MSVIPHPVENRVVPGASSMEIRELIDAILVEMDNVWGKQGFGGSDEEYEWLLVNFGITEEEDVRWQFVLEYYEMGDLPEDAEEEDVEFLEDREAVVAFLGRLLQKYQSCSATRGE